MITDNDDTQRYMNKAEPVGDTYNAQITLNSKIMAILCGRDPQQLKERAHVYASAMNWRRAIVTMSRSDA